MYQKCIKMETLILLQPLVSIYYRSIHSVIIKLYCACHCHSKSLSSELATGVRNWRQIDFDPLGSNKKCNANKLICIFKTNTLLINLCTINFAISISNVVSSHRREPCPEPATLVYYSLYYSSYEETITGWTLRMFFVVFFLSGALLYKTNTMTCAPSEDSDPDQSSLSVLWADGEDPDQIARIRRLIRVHII